MKNSFQLSDCKKKKVNIKNLKFINGKIDLLNKNIKTLEFEIEKILKNEPINVKRLKEMKKGIRRNTKHIKRLTVLKLIAEKEKIDGLTALVMLKNKESEFAISCLNDVKYKIIFHENSEDILGIYYLRDSDWEISNESINKFIINKYYLE